MAIRFACKLASSKKSAQYGIRFSYPLYILSVTVGIFLVNPYILAITAVLAFLGVILSMHPFDYIYNYVVTRLIGTSRIPGRGTESQVSSFIALLFNISVIALIIFNLQLNYTVMALIYFLISTFFVIIQLSTNEFSIYSIYGLISNRKKQ